MKKEDLLKAIAEHADISQAKARLAYDALISLSQRELSIAKEVTLPGIVKFQVVHKEPRKGRNPQNGAEIEIAARDVVKAKALAPINKI